MSFSYISNVPYSCVVSMKGYEYLRSAERIYSRSPPRTSWVHFSGHWRPSIHDRYLAHISRSWSTKDNSIEICKRWKEYKPTHMVSRSWSVMTTQSRHVVNNICELGRGHVHFLLNDTSELGRDHVHFLQCVCVDDDVNEIEIASIRRSLLCYVWDCKRLHEQFGLKAPPWAMLLSR